MNIGMLKDPEIRVFNCAGKAQSNFVMVTGENIVTVKDVNDTLMGVNIAHVYRKGVADDGKGVGFRLNLNEKFYRENESDYFYKYVNSFGDETRLITRYYYINSNGEKEYVTNLSEVVSDSNGRFFYGDKQLKTDVLNGKGLKTVEFTPDKSIKYGYLIDKRKEEVIQLESAVQEYEEILDKYVLFDTTDGKIIELRAELNSILNAEGTTQSETDTETVLTVQNIEKLINHLQSGTAKILTSRENATLYKNEYENGVSDENANYQQLKENLTAKKDEYLQLFKNQVVAYHCAMKNLREEKAKTPINYILDGEQHKGYNYYGDLVCVFDKFGNSTMIEYGLTQINGADYYTRIDRIYNSDDKQIVFEYVSDKINDNQAERLKRITTSTGESVSYKYDEGYLTELEYSDGTKTILTYTDGVFTGISDSDKLKTEFAYSDEKLSTLTEKTQISVLYSSGETEEEKTVTEYTFTYTPKKDETDETTGNTDETDETTDNTDETSGVNLNKACIIAYDEVREKYVLSTDENDLGALTEYYFEKCSLVTEATKINYEWSPENGHPARRQIVTAKKEILNLNDIESFTLNEYDWQMENFDYYNNYKVVYTYTNAVKINSEGTCTKTVNVNYYYDDDYENILETKTTEYINWTDNSQTSKNIVTREKYFYDSNGVLVKTETFVEGEEKKGSDIEEYVYDKKGRLLKEISYNSLNPTSKYYTENEYDDDNRIKSQTDALGNKKEFYYNDKTQEVERVRNSDGSETTYGHDSRGNLTAISKVDENIENANRIRYKYNLPVEYANGDRKYTFSYDYKRRLSSVSSNQYIGYNKTITDEVGQNKKVRTKYQITKLYYEDEYETEYYPDGRIKEEKYLYKDHHSNSVLPTKVLYTYNDGAKKDLVATIQDNYAGKTHEFAYDEMYREVEHKQGLYKEETAYTDTGEVQSEKYFCKTAEDGEWQQFLSNTYSYSNDSRKDLISLAYGIKTDYYEYDELSRLSKVKSSKNGGYLTEKYGYYKNGDHATDLINNITYLNGEDIVKREYYTYDKNGNVISVNENGSQIKSYTYDKIGRLIKEKDIDLEKEICYTYDEKGNILVKEVNGEKTYYGYGKGNTNNYDSESERLTKIGNESITYDFIGNPLTYRGATCSWERLNLLSSFTKDGETATFVYDKDKLLSKKTVGDEVTEYVWFDGKLIREKTGDEYVDYYYGTDGIEGFKHSSLGTYYYRKNLFGDITEIVDTSGNIKGKYAYTGYGECSIITDVNSIASINPFRYRGYYFEKSTGLYYLKSRYYDAYVGRFITFDVLENLDSEHIDGLNLYAYCNNNPIDGIDPNGNWSIKKAWKKVKKTVKKVVKKTEDFVEKHANQIKKGALVFSGTVAAIGLTCITLGSGSVLGGAIIAGCIGAGVETFDQVAIKDKSFSDVNWEKVAIEGTSSFVGSYVMGTINEVRKNATFLNTILGGSFITHGMRSVLNFTQGEKLSQESFGQGVLKEINSNFISSVIFGRIFKGG